MVERIVRSKAAKARGAANVQIGKAQKSATMSRRKEVYEDVTQEEHLTETSFPPGVEPAFVRVGIGQTYNLGNFESLRLDVSVTLPCLVEDVEGTYNRASEFVAEKLAEEETLWLGKSRG